MKELKYYLSKKYRNLLKVEEYLLKHKPKEVEVINDGKSCWLHYGGMIYSREYTTLPPTNYHKYMQLHLENHKWCLELADGVYNHKSILQRWRDKYLRNGYVIGAGSGDIIYAYEKKDRPVTDKSHTCFYLLHDDKFVIYTTTNTPMPQLTAELIAKTDDLINDRDIYFYPPPQIF